MPPSPNHSLSNPDPASPMATPNPQFQPEPQGPQPEALSLSIQSQSPRKLPIKRSPHPNPHFDDSSHAIVSYDDDEDLLDDDDHRLVEDDGGEPKTPPFKFHRVWTESDEIRFLQGLLGCWSRGMVFPRDLNLFFDRFSESMPQPYTRPQLADKLRRLRRKFRTLSGRVARGQDPSRLAPHDRDVLHLCMRLWHPSYASSSPFSSPDSHIARGRDKRRRPNPIAPSAVASSASPPSLLFPPPETTSSYAMAIDTTTGTAATTETTMSFDEKGLVDVEVMTVGDLSGVEEVTGVGEKTIAARTGGNVGAGQLTVKSILKVFDELSSETRMELIRLKEKSLDASDLERRWKEQRFAELDMLAGKLRLVLENSIRNLN